MSTLTAERAAWSVAERPRGDAVAPGQARMEPARSTPDGAGGGPTLDEFLAGVWERLTVHAVVECPVCNGAMEPEYGAHALPIAGRCRDCGSRLG